MGGDGELGGVVRVGGGLVVLTWHPFCFSFSSLPTPFPSLPTPSHPYSPLTGCVTVHGWLHGCSGRVNLSRLAEFQTPIILDHDFDFHCSIFYRAHKIVKIIIYTLYVHRNVSTI
jgi:hypothetical protein